MNRDDLKKHAPAYLAALDGVIAEPGFAAEAEVWAKKDPANPHTRLVAIAALGQAKALDGKPLKPEEVDAAKLDIAEHILQTRNRPVVTGRKDKLS